MKKQGIISRRVLVFAFFFLILGLAFYFTLTVIIPGFGKKKVSPISFVRPFSFTNQNGISVTDKDLAGKVYVSEFFLTHCSGICPIMNNNMKEVYKVFEGEPDFFILSHTSDPERDSVSQLKYYADSMDVNTERWIFLTGRKDSLYNMARVSYMIDDPANNLKSMDDDFLHSQFWALVDRKGDVVKIYDGLKRSEAVRLIKDVKRLLQDKD